MDPIDVSILCTLVFVVILANSILGHMINCRAVVTMYCIPERFPISSTNYNLLLFYKFARIIHTEINNHLYYCISIVYWRL